MDVAPLVGKQRDAVLHCTAAINLFEGSVRSSKTISSIIAWLQFVRTAPPGELLMAGRTERTIKRNVIDVMVDMLGQKRCRYVQGAGELHLLGRRIYVVGANDERSQEKIRGLTLAGSYVDEVTTLPESFWTMLRSRHSVAGAQMLGTSNPDGPSHWLLVNWLSKAKLHITGDGQVITNDSPEALNLHRFSFRLADNPTLPAQYVEDIKRDYTGLWRKRFIEGAWVAAEGAIYDMLDEALHVASAPSDLGACWLGIDYGTSNPTHAVLLATDWAKQRLHAVAEWRHDGRAKRSLTDAELSQQLRQWVAGLPFDHDGITTVLDPSAASFRVQLRADGWATQPADNRVLDGIRSVSNLFAQGRLVVDTDRCPELWRELQGYAWSAKAQKEGRDEPIKQNDHGADSLRYSAMAAWSVWRAWTGAPLSLAAAA